MASALTPDQMRDLLATLLEGAAGKSRGHWLKAIGEVEHLTPIHMHISGNWRVHPTGSKADMEAIVRAVDVVRAQHPYVSS
jgi:hypothetical protein